MLLQTYNPNNTTFSVIRKHFNSFDRNHKVVNNRCMLKNRFKKARIDAGFTQIQLAEKANSSQASINKIESGLTMRPRNIDTFAFIMKVSPEWLQFGVGGGSNITNAQPIKKMIPVISWVQAGEFCEGNVLELHDVDEWLPCPVNASDKTFGLRVNGDSMTSPHRGERSYPEGIVIYVDPEAPLSSGRRVIAKSSTSEESTFKTYIEDGGLKYLIPINPQYPTVEMKSNIHICGVIIGAFWPE